jgi:hypothetical protein
MPRGAAGEVFADLGANSRYGQRVSAQRVRTAAAADHRSIHPGLPGLPWWAAVIVAVTATTVGIALDAGSGNKELTHSFAAMYALGCLVAVLAVRQSGVFTAVIQPPLILFCAVPGAYWLYHGATINDIKGILINCGYPLIERFPLMLFVSAGVLLIGMCRWYFATDSSSQPKADAEATATAKRMPSVAEKLGTKFAAVLNRRPAHAAGAATRRRRAVERAGRNTARPRGSGSARRSAPTGSRHVRPEFNDAPDPGLERPRRQRRASAHQEEPPLQRRSGPAQESTRRGRQTRKARHSQPVREDRRRQSPREPRRSEPAGRTRRSQPTTEIRRDPRRRPGRPATNGSGATHHPISQVRYRQSDPNEDFREPRGQPRTRSNGPAADGADSWEYDI